MDIQLTVSPGLNLPPTTETALYRIVQEGLTNIVKHAEATSVSIVVTNAGSSIRTVIEDNGKGFDESRVREGALGIVGMRERVALLGGRLEVQGSPGRWDDGRRRVSYLMSWASAGSRRHER